MEIVIDPLTKIVSYLNPLSENFILKIAFIPEEGFIQDNFQILRQQLNDKLGIGNFVQESIDIMKDMAEQEEWEGFSIIVPITGQEIQVVNPDPINTFSPYFKGFISAFLYLFTGIMLIKKLPTVLSA